MYVLLYTYGTPYHYFSCDRVDDELTSGVFNDYDNNFESTTKVSVGGRDVVEDLHL